MEINNKSRFFLFIEPTPEQKNHTAINDEYTSLLRMALTEAKLGKSNFKESVLIPDFKEGFKHRGTHNGPDGIKSSQQEYLLKNGLVTNSLCIHYLLFYRLAIQNYDWEKMKELQRFYGRSTMPQTYDLKTRRNLIP